MFWLLAVPRCYGRRSMLPVAGSGGICCLEGALYGFIGASVQIVCLLVLCQVIFFPAYPVAVQR